MTIIEGLRTYLATYTGLDSGVLHVDFLPEAAKTYSVDAIPTDPIVKQYTRGPAQKQFLFVISSREYFSEDTAQNMSNHEFYEGFSEWIDAQNRSRNFPAIGDNRTAQKIQVLTTPYPLIITEDGKARYQIQCRLEYYEK